MFRKLFRAVVIAIVVWSSVTQYAITITEASSLTIRGSETGQNFRLSTCPSGQVLVGVAAKQGWYIDSVAPLCSAVTSTGVWSGPVSQRSSIGGPGGDLKVAQCNENDAVVGMSGKIGRWVTALSVRCRKLASPSTVSSSGSTYSLSAGGASYGTIAAAQTCPDRRPVVALSGRYTLYVNELTMTCAD
jgi:hypothetical protein